MGEVYKAHDPVLDRFVALKIIRRDRALHPDGIRRFVQEAKAASALNHPHIVHVYDIGSVQQAGAAPIDFIAMEYIDGVTFGSLIHATNTPVARLLLILAQVADGLAKAHAAGIVHRDLKPDNIIVSSDGYAKIVDFGLAKLTSGDDVPPDAETQARSLTEDGMILGTAGYMAPEQVEGRRVDARADVFSFGCILYEAVTRKRAFEGRSGFETMQRVVQSPPEKLDSIEPAALRHLIVRCLAKDPEERLQSARDLAIEIRQLQQTMFGNDAPTTALRRPSRTWMLPLAAVSVLLLISIILVLNSVRRTRSVPPANAEAKVPLLEVTRVTTSGNVGEAAISPDGKYVAYVRLTGLRDSLWLRHLTTRSDVEIVRERAGLRGISFSSDGDYVYFTAISHPRVWSLERVPVLGGPATKLVDDVDTAAAFSPDGRRIAFVRNAETESFVIVSVGDGTGQEKVVTRKRPERVAKVSPAWSADGNRLAYVAADPARLVIFDLRSRQEREGTVRMRDIVAIVWTPDQRTILAAANGMEDRKTQIWRFDAETFEPARLTTGIDEYSGLSLSSNGSQLVSCVRAVEANLWVSSLKDPDRTREIERSTVARGSGGVTFLPEGRIAYTSDENRLFEIWAANIDGSEARPLLARSGVAYQWPASAGHLLAAQRWDRDGRFGFSLLDLTSGAERGVVGTGDGHPFYPQLSRNARSLYYMRENSPGLWKIDVDKGEPTHLIREECGNAAVSPDETRAACFSSGKLAVFDIASSRILRTIELPSLKIPIRWSPDGRSILVIEHRDDVSNIWQHPLDGGRPRQVTRFASDSIWFFDLAPDGDTILSSRGGERSDAVLVTITSAPPPDRITQPKTSPWGTSAVRVKPIDSHSGRTFMQEMPREGATRSMRCSPAAIRAIAASTRHRWRSGTRLVRLSHDDGYGLC